MTEEIFPTVWIVADKLKDLRERLDRAERVVERLIFYTLTPPVIPQDET